MSYLFISLINNLIPYFTQKPFTHDYFNLVLPHEKLIEYCAINYPQDPKSLMLVLKCLKIYHTER
jgi:hypothetical protein